MRRLLILLCVLLVAAPAAAEAATKPKVVIVGQNHHPLINRKWHYSVTVTLDGRRVPAFIHLQFLFNGFPVGEVGKHTVKDGFWQETFGTPGHPPFPPAARGQHLVLEATVTVKGHPSAKAGWWVVPK